MVYLNTPGSRDVITLNEDEDLMDMAGMSGVFLGYLKVVPPWMESNHGVPRS